MGDRTKKWLCSEFHKKQSRAPQGSREQLFLQRGWIYTHTWLNCWKLGKRQEEKINLSFLGLDTPSVLSTRGAGEDRPSAISFPPLHISVTQISLPVGTLQGSVQVRPLPASCLPQCFGIPKASFEKLHTCQTSPELTFLSNKTCWTGGSWKRKSLEFQSGED